jgi:hypothetical protein
VHLKLLKKNQKITICNRLDLVILIFDPLCPKISRERERERERERDPKVV